MEEVVWSVKENASLYDALHLEDRSNPQVWDNNAEVNYTIIMTTTTTT